MPTPTKPIILAAKNANLVAGVYVTFRNLTRSGKLTAEAKSGEVVANAPSTWVSGDVISIEVTGLYNQSAQITATASSAKNTFSSMTADTNTPAIDL